MTIKETIKKTVPTFLLGWYHFLLAILGAFLYRFPSRKLIIIGVTGTNGKSTVVEMCDAILREAGFKVASISSIRFMIGDKEWKNDLKMTMPGRFKLQKFLRDTVSAGCQYAILEVTSEGIKQHRHRFIDFDVAVLTNLMPEHIESHGSFEKYKEAKGRLFEALKSQITNHKPQTNHKSQIINRKAQKVSIINLDDENAEYFLQFQADKYYGYCLSKKEQNHRTFYESKHLDVVRADVTGSSPLEFRIGNTEFHLNLLGEFNIYNALAAICVGLSQGIDLQTIKKALEKIQGIPGRMEILVREPFTVIVDYAHTPDALEKVYVTVRSSKFGFRSSRKYSGSQFPIPNSQLICVLGSAGGGRDKWKRPEMGKIAAQHCDQIILTNEDPYNENTSSILEQIEAGFSQVPNSKLQALSHMKVLDRREAIRKALSLAKAGDVVIITGKGCEPWMCIEGGKKIPWDDRQIAKEEFKKLAG